MQIYLRNLAQFDFSREENYPRYSADTGVSTMMILTYSSVSWRKQRADARSQHQNVMNCLPRARHSVPLLIARRKLRPFEIADPGCKIRLQSLEMPDRSILLACNLNLRKVCRFADDDVVMRDDFNDARRFLVLI